MATSTVPAATTINSDVLGDKLNAACAKGMQLQLAGQLEPAEALYLTVLAAAPQHAAANYCLGMLRTQQKRPIEGLANLQAAIDAAPGVPDYWFGYLETLLLAGLTEDAQSTLELARRHGVAGAPLDDVEKRLSARAAQQRKDDLAASRQEKELNLAIGRGKFADAHALARTLTERFPARGLGWKVFGAFMSAESRFEAALPALQTAVRLMPDDAEAHVNLGLNLAKLGRLDEAETHFKRAIDIDPNLAAAYFRLAMIYGLRNRYAEAEACLRRGLDVKGDYVAGDGELSYSSFLFIVSHNPDEGADELFAKHLRVGERLEAGVRGSWPKHKNDKEPLRTLKIGFVSGDFYHHAVSVFIEPVLTHLKEQADLELHAYYNNTVVDEVTHRLREHFKDWHPVAGMNDAALARKITHDRIDILIDLSGHSAHNRLPVFARKPAPLQVSWIGYPGTTGLRAMDYYLADRFFLPPGQFDRHFTEKIAYLPANVPFQPFQAAPPVNDLPALKSGSLCFASFNRLGKINAATLKMWSAVLGAVPDATMLIGAVETPGQERSLIEQLAATGIARERLTFHPRCSMAAYLTLHHRVDICLDAYPYTGGTTTIQALWMGVPTLTVAGPTPASRQGAAILGQLGLEQFIAADEADLAAKGRYWSRHLAELAEVRSGLRARWQESPARQPALIAEGLGRALRHMWTRWCSGAPPRSF